jgi:hypothetical protein
MVDKQCSRGRSEGENSVYLEPELLFPAILLSQRAKGFLKNYKKWELQGSQRFPSESSGA